MEKEFHVEVGYSDHTLGIEVPIAAVALGAKVIEKHITLNKKLKGPDHKASLNPIEFKKMVKQIRKLETMMGNGKKVLQKCEIKNMLIARKSIVAKKNIKQGQLFSNLNLGIKRPAGGIVEARLADAKFFWDKDRSKNLIMKILSIYPYTHISSAALMIDGKIVAASPEERFNRIKMSTAFPFKAIDWCLKKANLKLDNIDLIASINPSHNINDASSRWTNDLRWKLPYYIHPDKHNENVKFGTC